MEERLVNTAVVKRSKWDEVCEIVDGYYEPEKEEITK